MASHSPGFTLVIVHRDQAASCATMIERFRAQRVPLDVVVVDNGSGPSQLEELRRVLDEGVTLLEAGANLGFGPGANVGLRRWLDRGRTEWVLVAPHDVDPAPHCLERLAAAIASRPVAGLACADVGDGQVPLIDPYFGGITRPAGVADGWEDADYPHGTLMAASRRCLSEIGLFDERYFAYCEEADLGMRARAAGWEVGLVHGARVTNTHLSSSVAVVDYLQQRNTLLLVREMSGRYHAFIRCCITLWHVLDGTLRPARRPPVFDPWARLVGMGDFLRGRFGPPPAAVVDRDRRAQLASR